MDKEQHVARAHGVRCLGSRHPEIRSLKRASPAAIHGTRQWPSSWILIDYLARHPLPRGCRVLEVGAGWGLTGIYCARRFEADVVAMDKDPAVFPYLELHARLNGVRIRIRRGDFRSVRKADLKEIDVLVGSDVCFWRSLIAPLGNLVRRALDAGVGLVALADPGRHTFETLAAGLVRQERASLVDWRTRRPRPRSGRILIAPGSLCGWSRPAYNARA